jgi:hypothetical protein
MSTKPTPPPHRSMNARGALRGKQPYRQRPSHRTIPTRPALARGYAPPRREPMHYNATALRDLAATWHGLTVDQRNAWSTIAITNRWTRYYAYLVTNLRRLNRDLSIIETP